MLKFFHHLMNPHCPHCLAEKESAKFCKGCDILQYEVERLRAENERLLSKVLQTPEPVVERTVAPEPLNIRPQVKNWAIKRQMLEAEDREKAKLLNQVPKASDATESLEKELLEAQTVRESQNASR